MHEADELDVVVGLLDADVLSGEDGAEMILRGLKQMRPQVVTMAVLW